jgi:hypothetical protein
MRVREAPVNPAAADKAMRFQYLANGGALTSITWGKFIAALPSMLPAPNSYVILNRARHSADTWILLRRTDDALAMEYRYGSPARQYASPPVTLEEALRVIHAFLQPPSDAAQRHHAIVAWTHVGPEHGDAFGVPELRNSYSQAGRTPSGSTGDGRQLSLARVRYDVRITSGGSSPTTTIQVRVGAQRNELVIAHDFLTVNKSYRVAVRKGAWTEFPLEVAGDANPGVTVRAAFRPAGWLTAAKLRLGDTIVSLASNSSGVAQALQTWRDL